MPRRKANDELDDYHRIFRVEQIKFLKYLQTNEVLLLEGEEKILGQHQFAFHQIIFN